jgi:serine/threonine protein kinase
LAIDNPKQAEVRRKDGAPLEPGIPKHIVYSMDENVVSNALSVHDIDCLQLIDFSSGKPPASLRVCHLLTHTAFFVQDPPEKVFATLPSRAPELLFQLPATMSIDIWALGCVVRTPLTWILKY